MASNKSIDWLPSTLTQYVCTVFVLVVIASIVTHCHSEVERLDKQAVEWESMWTVQCWEGNVYRSRTEPTRVGDRILVTDEMTSRKWTVPTQTCNVATPARKK